MKQFYLILISLSFITLSCTKKGNTEIKTPIGSVPTETTLEIPNMIIDKSKLIYNNKTALWLLDNKPYSGYAISYFPDNTIQEKTGILNGRKQNKAIEWYPDRHFKLVANYFKGKLHGEKKVWSPDTNHVLISQFNYHLGKAHGAQKKWYPTGEIYKKLNLDMGKEEGVQQAFRKNGDLYANYEAKNGRIFGLKKAALCYGLEDEKVQYEK